MYISMSGGRILGKCGAWCHVVHLQEFRYEFLVRRNETKSHMLMVTILEKTRGDGRNLVVLKANTCIQKVTQALFTSQLKYFVATALILHYKLNSCQKIKHWVNSHKKSTPPPPPQLMASSFDPQFLMNLLECHTPPPPARISMNFLPPRVSIKVSLSFCVILMICTAIPEMSTLSLYIRLCELGRQILKLICSL